MYVRRSSLAISQNDIPPTLVRENQTTYSDQQNYLKNPSRFAPRPAKPNPTRPQAQTFTDPQTADTHKETGVA